MNRKVRYVQFGCGKMGVNCVKFAVDKGAEIVGAFDANPAIEGMDIGERAGIQKLDVKIQKAEELDETLKSLKPDIAVVTTRSLVKEIYDVVMICVKNGVNVITSCEESIYPWTSSPRLTKELDEAAKANGVTITGSGAQELQWCSTICNLAGGINHITKIKGIQNNNIELYGIAFAESFGAGLTEQEFESKFGPLNNMSDAEISAIIEREEFSPGFFWNSNPWLIEKLGFTLKRQKQTMIPVIAEKDIKSESLGRMIKKGEARGAINMVTSETEEGLVIEAGVKAIVCGEDEGESNDWILYDGDVEFVTNQPLPPTVELTCSTLVNRIPDVINAPAGYVTSSHMNECKYLVKSMETYVK